MKVKAQLVLLSILSLSIMAQAADEHKNSQSPHWTYSGSEGPDNWAKLSPDFAACNGKNQSPIDLTGFIEAELAPIVFNYVAGGNEILNNGHTIQINYQPGSTIVVDGISFTLKQFHFHAPSENWIKGQSYPLEAHFVHADKDGNLAVIGVMFAEGKANPSLAQAWATLPQAANEKLAITSAINAEALLPVDRDYYRFNGSLTTPPCSEGVRWLVMKTPLSASKEQIAAFAKVIHHGNSRPIQSVNARPVLQ